MPLIVMCGYPCSGKSRRAEELKVYFEESTGKKVHVVEDGSPGAEKNTVYGGKCLLTLCGDFRPSWHAFCILLAA